MPIVKGTDRGGVPIVERGTEQGPEHPTVPHSRDARNAGFWNGGMLECTSPTTDLELSQQAAAGAQLHNDDELGGVTVS